MGGNLSNEDLEFLKSIGIKEKSTTTKNQLPRTHNHPQPTIRKKQKKKHSHSERERLNKQQDAEKNIRLSIIGRSNAAKSLAATLIDPSIHYPIRKDQTLEAQKIYDNYVIGTTKLGVKNSKYIAKNAKKRLKTGNIYHIHAQYPNKHGK